MEPISQNTKIYASKKRSKIHRTRDEISRKVVAFQELIHLKNKKSVREAADLLEIPRSTMEYWIDQEALHEIQEIAAFFSTPVGAKLLKRIFLAAHHVTHYTTGGIRSEQEFLELSSLNHFIASSIGALHPFSIRYSQQICIFGENNDKALAEKLKRRKISVGVDEMFRGRKPCLVAIDLVSGFILLEKFTADRTSETWKNELQPRTEVLNLEIDQVVSDLCGALTAYAKDINATHSPDLFHAQYELSKATAAPLASQEREFQKKHDEAEAKLEKVVKKHGLESKQAENARSISRLRKLGLEARQDRRKKIRNAKKELGKIDHPINMKTGKLQTAEEIKQGFDSQLKVIEQGAKEACLSESSMKRLAKARRAFDGIVSYVTAYFIWLSVFLGTLKLSQDEMNFFKEVVFPLSYLKIIWRRLEKNEREQLMPLRENLEALYTNSTYAKEEWMVKGREAAERFQRSTSSIEGRNSELSLYFHRFRRLGPVHLRAHTLIRNYHVTRSDGVTAAERFFSSKHENLFEFLVENVRIPNRPYKKRIDEKKIA
jgi:hypothetical protein